MKKILLIDADSTIPNLALMKISAYYRAQGCEVGFNVSDPDIVYSSIVFRKNRHMADGLSFYYPEAEIDVGGSGYDLAKELPPWIESMSPDYGLYPECDYYLGFTTRGCIRRCHFCIVHEKEGDFRKVRDVSDICTGHDFKNCVLMDNNILADKQHFLETSDWLRSHDIAVDFNQGLDARLMDEEIAQTLASLRAFRSWRIAFDSMAYRDDVIRAIGLMRDAGISLKHDLMCYVYCHSDENVDDAVARCRILKEEGVTAFSMLNIDVAKTARMQKLKDWTRPWSFWSCDYDEYSRAYKGKVQ